MPTPSEHQGPGLLDLQLNGYAGFDFNSGHESWSVEDFRRLRQRLASRGVLAALPTLITAPVDRLLAAARCYAALLEAEPELASAFPRLHIEGPFISPANGPRGAHPERWCRSPVDHPEFLEEMRDASGDRIGIITLAPELPGALDLIRQAAEHGVCVAIGHTMAPQECIAEAVAAGARLSTHLGNGSHQTLPRHDNYVQVQLAEDRLAASFIADGHHLPWFALQNMLRSKTPDRSVLITDAVAAADAPPGEYRVGESQVHATPAGRVQIPGQRNLAGSALTLDRAVLNVATHCGVPFEEAWAMASSRPAALLNLPPCPTVSVEISADGFRRVDSFGS